MSEILLTRSKRRKGFPVGRAPRNLRSGGEILTPLRMVLESAPGKNPVSHTGKVYTVAAQLLATELVREVRGVAGAHCLLMSRIGAPLSTPPLVQIELGGAT